MHASLDNNHAAAAGTSFFAPHAPLRARFFASFEFVLITLMLTLFTRVGLPPLIVGLPEEYLTGEQGDPFFLQLFYYGCYLTVAALIFRYMLQVGTMLFARPVLLVYIGYIFGNNLDKVLDVVVQIQGYLVAGIVIIIAGYVIWKKQRTKKTTSPEA